MRDNESLKIPSEEFDIRGKRISKTDLSLEDDDYLVLMSDGVVFAGSGTVLNYGFSLDYIVQYLQKEVTKDMSASKIAAILAKACDDLYGHKAYDDTTVAVIKKKKRNSASIMIGPPKSTDDDEEYVKQFLENKDYRIVCGGTTSKIVTNYLKEDVIMMEGDHDSPAYGYSESIDMVSEGLLTLKRVNELADIMLNHNYLDYEKEKKNDSASKIAEVLFEKVSDVNFYVGHGINLNHVGIVEDDKFELINELINNLKRMNKKINRFDY